MLCLKAKPKQVKAVVFFLVLATIDTLGPSSVMKGYKTGRFIYAICMYVYSIFTYYTYMQIVLAVLISPISADIFLCIHSFYVLSLSRIN